MMYRLSNVLLQLEARRNEVPLDYIGLLEDKRSSSLELRRSKRKKLRCEDSAQESHETAPSMSAGARYVTIKRNNGRSISNN